MAGRSFVKSNWLLITVLAAHLLLSMLYSMIVPAWEAYDETEHYLYVRYLITKRALPAYGGLSGRYYDEARQPPLYYILCALATAWVDTSDFQEPPENPFFTWMGNQGGLNLFIHSAETEAFPYRGTILALHTARLVSVLLSTIAVWMTYLTGRIIFPDRKEIALGATAINAFSPTFLFLGSIVNNDILVTLSFSVFLFFLIKVALSRPKHRELLGLGLSLGLALLSKNHAFALVPVALAGLLVAAVRERASPLLFLRWALIVFLVAALVPGWWYLRNFRLYGTPLPGYVAEDISMSDVLPTLSPRRTLFTKGALTFIVSYTFKSFWAYFGWGNVSAGNWIYWLLGVITLAGSIGLFLLLSRKASPSVKLSLAILILNLIAMMAFMAYRTLSYIRLDVFHGRYMVPTISAVSLLLTVGIVQLIPQRLARATIGIVATIMFSLALICLFSYIRPAYARPPILSVVDVQAISHPLDITYGDKMKLTGYEVNKETLKPGEELKLSLYWQALSEMDKDYSIFIHLLGWDGQLLGRRDVYPGRGSYPTSQWKAGDIIRDEYTIPILPEAITPSRCQIEAGLYDFITKERLSPFDREMSYLSVPIIAQVKVVPLEPVEFHPQSKLEANFGNKIALLGYDLDESLLHPGETLHLVLYWQAKGEMREDYTVFTHLLDEENRIHVQRDGQPLGGNYPTSLWTPGERLRDEYELIVSPEVPAGEYRLEVGMYLLSTGERLPVLDKEGRMRDDRIVLEKVQVVP